VLTWSILLYAFSAFAAGFAPARHAAVPRCTTFIGVCVEFVAAVAWLAELFPEPARREKVLGLHAGVQLRRRAARRPRYGLAVKYSGSFPAIHVPGFLTGLFGSIDPAHEHEAWRYTLMSGVIPAIPLIVIRPFLPESPVWAQKKAAGTLRRPSLGELFSPALRRTTLVTSVMFACSYGAAFGAIQHMPRIVPGMPDVRAKAEGKPVPQQRQIEQGSAANTRRPRRSAGSSAASCWRSSPCASSAAARCCACSGAGAARRAGHVRVPGDGQPHAVPPPGGAAVTTFAVGIFLAGLLTVGQFSFWGNYLPRVYPVHLRGTGESFAANIGGRMIGTSFAWVTTTLAVQNFMPGTPGPARLAYTAAFVALFVYALGLAMSFLLPEPPAEDAEDDDGHGGPVPIAGGAAVIPVHTQQAERA
jgi:hypothetical protein